MMNLLSSRLLTRRVVMSGVAILSVLCLSVAYASMERSVYPSDTREPASTLTKKPSAIVENEGTQPKKGVTAEQSESNAESASEQMWEARAQRAGN